MMANEHLYSELLEIIKRKERERETIYQQIELELPQIDEQKQNETKKQEGRGVIIIDLA